ncbi:MAG: hypothetical protein K9J27_07320 [Bacteroidales bacterium]|nr:hypothetical protein [Bacteroidales bacterium]MCF8334858.1 hypothetical protein [Bacteroidales bacterium]
MQPGDIFEMELTEGKHTIKTSCIYFYRSPKREITIEKGSEKTLYTAIKEDGLGTARFGLYQLIDFKSFLILQRKPYTPVDNRKVYHAPAFFNSWRYALLVFLLITVPMVVLWSYAPETSWLYFISLLILMSFAVNLLYMWPKKKKFKAVNRFGHFIDFHAATVLALLIFLFHDVLAQSVVFIAAAAAFILYAMFTAKHFLSEKQSGF